MSVCPEAPRSLVMSLACLAHQRLAPGARVFAPPSRVPFVCGRDETKPTARGQRAGRQATARASKPGTDFEVEKRKALRARDTQSNTNNTAHETIEETEAKVRKVGKGTLSGESKMQEGA